MAKKGKKSSGLKGGRPTDAAPSFPKVLLAALVAGGGLFAGIRFTDRAQALVNGVPSHHVVELVPPEEVGKAPGERPAKPHHSRRVSAEN